MQNLGKVLIIFIFSIGYIWSASVKATVSSSQIVYGDNIELYIKATGENIKFPTITRVQIYRVLSSNSSNNRSYVYNNGSMQSDISTTKSYVFMPKKDMTIPSYDIEIEGKIYKTKPIDIKIIRANSLANTNKNSALYSLQLTSSKKRVMVGESLVLTAKFSLKNNIRLSRKGIQYSPPSFQGFTFIESAEDITYDSGNFRVQEIKYILTAQEEGNLSITPASAKIGMPNGGRRDIFGMSFNTIWKQIISNSLNIEVLPQPKESDLVGEFKTEATINTQKATSNEPVNLKIKIEGKGNLENFEIPEYKIEGVTTYTNKAEIETTIKNGTLYSSYIKSFVFISDNNFTIPAKIFSMLNSKTEKIEELKIDSFDIEIESKTDTTPSKGVVQTNRNQKEIIEIEKKVEWWKIAIVFISGMLSLYILQLLSRIKLKKNPYKESKALNILYPHSGSEIEIEKMVRKLYAKKKGDKSIKIDKKELKTMVERFIL